MKLKKAKIGKNYQVAGKIKPKNQVRLLIICSFQNTPKNFYFCFCFFFHKKSEKISE